MEKALDWKASGNMTTPLEIPKSKPQEVFIKNVVMRDGKDYNSTWSQPMYEVETDVGTYIAPTIRKQQQAIQNGNYVEWDERIGDGIEVFTNFDGEYYWINSLAPNNESGADNVIISLEEALSDKSQEGVFYLYKIEAGGDVYIGFTSQEPKRRLEQHIESAKKGSKNRIHRKLREVGYYNEFEVLKTFSHEVEALLNEIIYIKKYNAKLNITEGGEGKKYKITRGENELGENVFEVVNLESQKEIAKQQEVIDALSNGTVLVDFMNQVSKISPEIGVLAEIYKQYDSKSDFESIPVIIRRNLKMTASIGCHKGEDFGLDNVRFKEHLDDVLKEIENPSPKILQLVMKRHFYGSRGIIMPSNTDSFGNSYSIEKRVYMEVLRTEEYSEYSSLTEESLITSIPLKHLCPRYYKESIPEYEGMKIFQEKDEIEYNFTKENTCFYKVYQRPSYQPRDIVFGQQVGMPTKPPTEDDFYILCDAKFDAVKGELKSNNKALMYFYCFGKIVVEKNKYRIFRDKPITVYLKKIFLL